MADGFSEDVASSAIGAEAAASPGPCTKSIAAPAQDLAKVEMMLLSIYWYLYYDQDVPSVLNQSWPTVWLIFEQMNPDASLAFERAPMRKHLLDEGYTCQPEGIVGNEGLRRRSIVKLRREGLIVGKGKQRDLLPQTKQAIVKAAWVVARDIIEKSIGSFPDKFSILREIEPEKMTWSSAEQALDREPNGLNDKSPKRPLGATENSNSKLDQHVAPIFEGALDKGFAVEALRRAQIESGLSERKFIEMIGVSRGAYRSVIEGRATIDKATELLRDAGFEIHAQLKKSDLNL